MTRSLPEQRLTELGLTLPEPSSPLGIYVNAVTVERVVYLAGHGPLRDGAPAYRGRVPTVVTVDEAQEAARLTALNLLATLRAHVGSLDRVQQMMKLFGMVNADPHFTDHPTVIDGASSLLLDVFAERGKCARSAVGVSSLPFEIPVEIELIVGLGVD